jgi:hypothetical protein
MSHTTLEMMERVRLHSLWSEAVASFVRRCLLVRQVAFLRILKVFEVDGAGFDGFWASTFSWAGFWGLGRDLTPEGPGLFDLFEGLLKLKMGCVLFIVHEKLDDWMQNSNFSML